MKTPNNVNQFVWTNATKFLLKDTKTLLLILAGSLWTGTALAGDTLLPTCLMHPRHLAMSLPDRELTWLPGENLSGEGGDVGGKCDNVSARPWIRNASGTVDLFVNADGPAGSGRYWDVMVGIGSKQQTKPLRGICLKTSTVGWRTLKRYKKGALSWLDDVDGDGTAELIVWDSFPLRDNASLAEYALVAWVYRLVSQDSLVIDWNLSRSLARSIAEEYRSPPDITAKPFHRNQRIEAAEALESFADERCRI